MTSAKQGDELLPHLHRADEERRVLAALHALESNIARTLSDLDRLVEAPGRDVDAPVPDQDAG
jgi:hypothetical protein